MDGKRPNRRDVQIWWQKIICEAYGEYVDLDKLCRDWEGVQANANTNESGTIHSGTLFTILQAHWKPVDGFFDAGCGSGIVMALASMWVSIHNHIFPAGGGGGGWHKWRIWNHASDPLAAMSKFGNNCNLVRISKWQGNEFVAFIVHCSNICIYILYIYNIYILLLRTKIV